MRRIDDPTQYEFLQHLQHWNVFMTVSARFVLGAAQIIFVVELLLRACSPGKKADREPVARRTRSSGRRPRRRRTATWADDPDRLPRALRVQRPEATEDYLPQSAGGAGARAAGAGTDAATERGGTPRVTAGRTGWPCVTAAATVRA